MLNTLIAEGRLVKEVSLKTTDHNFVYALATIASKRRFKDRETGKYESDFIQLYLTKDTAKNFASFCHQGDLVSIVGRLQTDRRIGKDGEVSYYTNVVVSEFTLLTKKKTEVTASNKNDPDKQKKVYPSLMDEPPIDTNFAEMNLPPTVEF